MVTIELAYFPDCPHVTGAREQLRRALAGIGLPATWVEHDVTSGTAPAHVRGYGSPTILVDGRDVTGAAPGQGTTCRIYAGSEVRGVPPLDAIVAAIRAAHER